jgi:hypothetical protein
MSVSVDDGSTRNGKGDDVVLHDVFAKVITWANKFIQIGDTIMQYDPGHAALPWAGIRLMLQIAVSDSQTMGAMSEGIELVSSLITLCAVQESLYLRRPSAIEEELRKALINLYTAVLTYMSKALRYYEQPTISMSPAGFSCHACSRPWNGDYSCFPPCYQYSGIVQAALADFGAERAAKSLVQTPEQGVEQYIENIVKE